MMVSESKGSGGGVLVTVTAAGVVAMTTVGGLFVLTAYSAVILLEPGFTPVTTPSALSTHTGGVALLQLLVGAAKVLTVAIEGTLEAQLTAFVKSMDVPISVVPIATKLPC
jgi:hypothetical protein